MPTLLEKRIKVSRTVTTNTDQARAIGDPTRFRILRILYHRSMNAEQIVTQLNKSGHKKAMTTIRHHLEILKEAGLIEVARIDEVRGAITKYYGTSTRLLGYEAPDDFDSRYSSVIKSTAKKLEDVFKTVSARASSGSGKRPDPQYSQYLMMEIMNRVMTQMLEKSQKAPARGR
ncbi:transcriptional regulator [Cenarchaeum symbiosum A]|uniref:Transcriptional regulator n=1 Tax=Cenarchaeum symbiosum (strain A) TaxID=414004 RepID=A0RW00_CENSY|nr:transcriptional regulator [Cenarchaeum symbiosum A]